MLRVDYSNAALAGVPKVMTNKVQRVLNAAARVVSGTHEFERGLLRLLHTELHWLDFPEQVMYKLDIMVFNCLHGQAASVPRGIVPTCCIKATSPICHMTAPSRTVPQAQHLRAFCVAGQSV